MTETRNGGSASKSTAEPNAFGIGCTVLAIAMGVALAVGVVYMLSWLIGSTAAIVIIAFVVALVLATIVSASASEKKAGDDVLPIFRPPIS